MTTIFPFSAILGQEAMTLALLLNAVDPGLGGVLIQGDKGTGKSTAARGMAMLMPRIHVVEGCAFHCDPDKPDELHDACHMRWLNGDTLSRTEIATPFVELPLNATEDRVAGTLQLEEALSRGEHVFEPGLLARANRGILYVDEVNLLDDHLVDLLLDAAASGINRVEREGFSLQHPARFILIGTMNPEEGELRPQFLDRFALCAYAPSLDNPEVRACVARNRIEFETDPHAFLSRWSQEEHALCDMIRTARMHLHQIHVGDDIVEAAVHLSMEMNARGHRADIVLIRAARAFAALSGQSEVTLEDVAEMAPYALMHRAGRGPAETMETVLERIQTATEGTIHGLSMKQRVSVAPQDELDEIEETMHVPGAAAAPSPLTFLRKKKAKTGAMIQNIPVK